MSRTTLERLTDAQAANELVRVSRRSGWDRLDGYVAGIGAKWVLLATIDDRIRPDGFHVIRLGDVKTVKRNRHRDRFVRHALELDGAWPLTAPPDVSGLDRTRDVVEGLAGPFPLISVFIEREDPDVCFIGQPQDYTAKTFRLREVSPNAEWDGPKRRRWSRWRFGELTRIDAGGGYESALARVAGERDTPGDAFS